MKPNLLVEKFLNGGRTEEGRVYVLRSLQKETQPLTEPGWKFEGKTDARKQKEPAKLYEILFDDGNNDGILLDAQLKDHEVEYWMVRDGYYPIELDTIQQGCQVNLRTLLAGTTTPIAKSGVRTAEGIRIRCAFIPKEPETIEEWEIVD